MTDVLNLSSNNWVHLIFVCVCVTALVLHCRGFECGIANPDGVIVQQHGKIGNGVRIQRGEFPFIAALHDDNVYFCGATLIAVKHVLTGRKSL